MATTSFSAGPFSASRYDPLASFDELTLNGAYGGWWSNFWNKKSEKRAYRNQLRLMDAQYRYAQRYAENSPSWNVAGLRAAGLNPILAVSNGANLGANVPSVPSATPMANTFDNSSHSQGHAKYDPMYNKQMENLEADTNMKNATAQSTTMRAQADVSEANARIDKLRNEVEASQGYKNPVVSDIVHVGRSIGEGVKRFFNIHDEGIENTVNSSVRAPSPAQSVGDIEEYLKNKAIEFNKIRNSPAFEKIKERYEKNEEFFKRQRERELERRKKIREKNSQPNGLLRMI